MLRTPDTISTLRHLLTACRTIAVVGLSPQWLHAHTLGFTHPSTGEYVEFTSAYPADLQHALDVLAAG